ncbi:MAG TPA: hypothetical protein VFN97_17125 [Actinospica sp.]|nr:hypothetical protein [Actinospica sp.]
MSPQSARPEEAAESSRLPTLLWLAWRFLPPLDRDDQRTLTWIAVSCGYLAVPLTVGLASDDVPGLTLLSLLFLSAPGLPIWWMSALPLGARRRETALALRQARINTRSAAATSISRQVAYPTLGAILGTVLITLLHGPIGDVLPKKAPLAIAIRHSSGHWLLAGLLSVVILVALTAVLSSERSAECYAALRRLAARLGRREAAPQPQ